MSKIASTKENKRINLIMQEQINSNIKVNSNSQIDKVKILSLESAGAVCSAALSYDDQIIAEYTIFAPSKHDKFLAEFAKRLLDDFNLKTDELSAVAVSAGPGSFTGLRISGSIAKALCFEGSPKLIAVPNLHAFAKQSIENAGKADMIYSATIKAQTNLLYYQDFSADMTALCEPQLIEKEEYAKRDLSNTIICGSAAYLFDEYKTDRVNTDFSAKLIAKRAIDMYRVCEFADANAYTPLYIQEFEVKTKKKNVP